MAGNSKGGTASVKVVFSYRPAIMVMAVGLAIGAAACSPDSEEATSTPSSAVIQPGKPGEGSTTVSPEDFVDDDTGDPRWNQVDADFMTMMIGHHLQALEMAQLAPDRAEHEQVRAIADRINDTQGAEIHGLAAWLEERELPVPVDAAELDGEGPRAPESHGGHGTGPEMPGMITEDEMAALEAA